MHLLLWSRPDAAWVTVYLVCQIIKQTLDDSFISAPSALDPSSGPPEPPDKHSTAHHDKQDQNKKNSVDSLTAVNSVNTEYSKEN